MRREYRERFPCHRLQRKPLVSDHLREARAVMYVGIANPRWRGKRSRHSRRMRNPQFYVSGKKPMMIEYFYSLQAIHYPTTFPLNKLYKQRNQGFTEL